MAELERINKKVNDMAEMISYNTSKGSFARDIISSVAIEMVKEEDDYSKQLDKRLLDTATDENLDIVGADKAFVRNEPVKASGEVKITGVNGSVIKKGYIVINSLSSSEYEILEDKTINNISTTVKILCLKAGKNGNAEIGQINKFKEEYNGLSKVENTEVINNGRDLESDEEFRNRILEHIQKPRISWNKYVLQDKVLEVKGVKQSHCISRINGAGTVKIVITEQDKDTVSEELKKKVKDYIELEIISDVNITVEGIINKEVELSITCILNKDFNDDSAKVKLKEVLNNYFLENIFKDKIYYYDIVEVIQHSGCIDKLSDVTISGAKNDIVLNEDKLLKVNNIILKSL